MASGDIGRDAAVEDLSTVDDVGPDLSEPDLGPCGGCEAPLLCDTASGTCVTCLAASDCSDGVCDSSTGECVGCLGNGDCPDVTSSTCDLSTNTCAPCAVNDDCAHLSGTTVCDAGECVECTGTSFDACGGKVCDSRLRTCSAEDPGMTGLCGACVSDAQCQDGMLCVPMMFEAADNSGPAEVGTFCLWERDATVTDAPAGDCVSSRPYVKEEAATSLDGTASTVCGLALSTCPALLDFRQTDCTAQGSDASDECGAVGFDDGYCGPFSAQTRCTTFCGSDDDCRFGFTCNTGANPPRCNLQ